MLAHTEWETKARLGYFLYARTGQLMTAAIFLAIFSAISIIEPALWTLRWVQLPFTLPLAGNLVLLGYLIGQLQGRAWAPRPGILTVRAGSDYGAKGLAFASAILSLVSIVLVCVGYYQCTVYFGTTKTLANFIFNLTNTSSATLGDPESWYRRPYFYSDLGQSQACLDDTIVTFTYLACIVGLFITDIVIIVIEGRMREDTRLEYLRSHHE